MILIKRIQVFLLLLVCIIVFFSVTTSSYALPYPAGAGRGTLDCDHFIDTTNQIDDDGELSGLSYIYRLEYVQWAFGFFTAFNIRHYEKTNTFKDLRPIANEGVNYGVIYKKLIDACEEVKNEENMNFAMAIYLIFSNLPGESI